MTPKGRGKTVGSLVDRLPVEKASRVSVESLDGSALTTPDLVALEAQAALNDDEQSQREENLLARLQALIAPLTAAAQRESELGYAESLLRGAEEALFGAESQEPEEGWQGGTLHAIGSNRHALSRSLRAKAAALAKADASDAATAAGRARSAVAVHAEEQLRSLLHTAHNDYDRLAAECAKLRQQLAAQRTPEHPEEVEVVKVEEAEAEAEAAASDSAVAVILADGQTFELSRTTAEAHRPLYDIPQWWGAGVGHIKPPSVPALRAGRYPARAEASTRDWLANSLLSARARSSRPAVVCSSPMVDSGSSSARDRGPSEPKLSDRWLAVRTCMYARMHAHMHTCTHTCTHARTHVRTHARTHARMHAHMHLCMYACMHSRPVGAEAVEARWPAVLGPRGLYIHACIHA